MTKTKLTENIIQSLATSQSFQRGEEYFHTDAVSTLVQRDDILTARVEGSEYDPYEVSIHLHDGGVAKADCSCPYDWGGYCKHIVAVMLACVHNPDNVDQRESISNILKNLDQSQLLALLKKRMEIEPRLADWIEAEISISKVSSKQKKKGKSKRRTLVDPEPIRRQAQNLLRGSGKRRDYWDDYESSDNTDELQRLVESSVPFLESGDGRNALQILEPIADTFVSDWTDYRYGHDDEDMYLLFSDLGNLFAEAILSADLSKDERRKWSFTFQEWQEELDKYGVDVAFLVAIDAANQGWDDNYLQEILKGKHNNRDWKEDACWYDELLTEVQLRILERQGRTEEYLNLAKAADEKHHYAIMLVKLDRIDEAVAFGRKEFELPSEALDLAKVLQEFDHHEEAMIIGNTGLYFTGENKEDYHDTVVPLAHWLRDFAGGLGEGELAFRAAEAAFLESLTLEDYKSVKVFAEEEWDKIRPSLLEYLAVSEHEGDRTEIYLFEKMVDEAVQSIDDKEHYVRDDTLKKVSELAVASHPDWVIKKCCKRAESIMDGGKAKYYEFVVSWLRPVQQAHRIQERDQEWSLYLERLIAKHIRKYKLRPLLEGMRVMMA